MKPNKIIATSLAIAMITGCGVALPSIADNTISLVANAATSTPVINGKCVVTWRMVVLLIGV